MSNVGYVRLSRDEDKENYSSIIEQKKIINRYAKENNIILDKIYVDDNYSGYTFDRPDFQQMMKEVENGNIQSIIVKDLSRIGRKNWKMLQLIEYFMDIEMNIVMISGKNGMKSLEENEDMMGIYTWMDEYYVKDISRKIRTSLHSRQKDGRLIVKVPFGYKYDNKKILIDDNVSHIIKKIFELYLEGNGCVKISNYLNDNNILTPSQYEKKTSEEHGKVYRKKVTEIWNSVTILTIVSNDFYTGTLTTRKYHAKRIHGKTKKVNDEEQYKFENNHKAIIDKTTFELVQKIKTSRKNNNFKGKAKNNYLFSGLVRCADCNTIMSGKIRGTKKGYECNKYMRYGTRYCHVHFVEESWLLDQFKLALHLQIEKYKKVLQEHQVQKKQADIKVQISRLKKELDATKQELKVLYNQKIKDLIKINDKEMKIMVEESYSELENDKTANIKLLQDRIEELSLLDSNKIEDSILNILQVYNNLLKTNDITNKTLQQLLDNVIINAEGKNRLPIYDFSFKL